MNVSREVIRRLDNFRTDFETAKKWQKRNTLTRNIMGTILAAELIVNEALDIPPHDLQSTIRIVGFVAAGLASSGEICRRLSKNEASEAQDAACTLSDENKLVPPEWALGVSSYTTNDNSVGILMP